MRKERKHYTGEEKVAILRRHLLDKAVLPAALRAAKTFKGDLIVQKEENT